MKGGDALQSSPSAASISALQGATIPVSAAGGMPVTIEAEEDKTSTLLLSRPDTDERTLFVPKRVQATGGNAARLARSCALLCVFLC